MMALQRAMPDCSLREASLTVNSMRSGSPVAIEAGKQLYAANLQVERKRFRRPIVVPFPRPARPAHSGRVG